MTPPARKRAIALVVASALGATAFVVKPADAKILGVSSNATVVSIPPASLLKGALANNNTAFVISERQNITLGAPVTVDITRPGSYSAANWASAQESPAPVIASGTKVSSFLVHFDSPTGNQVTGSVTFDTDVLGIAVLGARLSATNSVLGNVITVYPPVDQSPGLSFNTPGTADAVTLNGRTVSFTLRTATYVDQLRIVTKADPTGNPDTGDTTKPKGVAFGYRMSASDGGVFTFGRNFYGSFGNVKLAQPISGMVDTATHEGYWVVAQDGGVFTFGDASFYGSAVGQVKNATAVAMDRSGPGAGYRVVFTNGQVKHFGDAVSRGDFGTLGVKPAAAIVGIASVPGGNGYWLVGADGGVFAFGDDAGFFGGLGGTKLNSPIVAIRPTNTGKGYWLFAADGGAFAFGDAKFFGSLGATKINKPIVAATVTPTGNGYWMFASDGGVFTFGDAPFVGAVPPVVLNKPVNAGS